MCCHWLILLCPPSAPLVFILFSSGDISPSLVLAERCYWSLLQLKSIVTPTKMLTCTDEDVNVCVKGILSQQKQSPLYPAAGEEAMP